jgi:hypothetical protein
MRLQTQYQSINNVAHLMFKDKLSNLRLHEGDLLLYFKQIQEIQLELQGINQCVPKVDVVEQLFNTLPPNHETIYNVFNGQDVPPTFETIMTCLIQEKAHINTWHGPNALAKKNALAMKMQFFSPYKKAPSNYGSGGGGGGVK